MQLTDDKIFKTRKSRNEIYEKIIFAYSLCETLEDLELTNKEYERDLEFIRLDDEQNKNDWHVPILPEIESEYEECKTRMELIKCY